MNFEKKLVILTGKTGSGTALLERNGLGSFLTVNAFSLPDLNYGEYAVGVKTDRSVYRREVGSLGRIKSRFSLPEGEYTAVHIVLFRTLDEEVMLYGTTDSRKLWEGNIMDGLRRIGIEKKTSDGDKAEETAQVFEYSGQKIEDYFLKIDAGRYYDGALAEVNYFDYTQSSDREGNTYYDVPPTPDEMQRRYLDARFSGKGKVYATACGSSDDSIADGELNSRDDETDLTERGAMKEAAATSEVSSPFEPAVPVFEPVPLPDAKATAENAGGKKSPYEPEKPVFASSDGGELKIKKASDYTVEQAVAAVKTSSGFYAQVKSQLDKLFSEGERFAPLENALPGTRWVKVNYDDSGRYYVLGLIGSAPDYIAYGVPGKYGDAPALLEGADFVPLVAQNPSGDGFWVLFQSAVTGKEIIKNP